MCALNTDLIGCFLRVIGPWEYDTWGGEMEDMKYEDTFSFREGIQVYLGVYKSRLLGLAHSIQAFLTLLLMGEESYNSAGCF